ncbi:hypothetical protein HPB50_011058 [Hyalomma asiaticum]|uniref:Uncharacterized protein n=1 Tax=Hyalomma asiaticum TaxID=266040 RepID=A0ACB7T0F0_HYAAI|nr:hypothetical protein HPB50_011058 [Hyalomma asiaticum]
MTETTLENMLPVHDAGRRRCWVEDILRSRGRRDGVFYVDAASASLNVVNEDVVCPNFTQDFVVVSTLKPDHAANDGWLEESTSGTPAPLLQENRARAQPPRFAAKRIKTSGSAFVLFDGLRVPNFVRYGPTLRRTPLGRVPYAGLYSVLRVWSPKLIGGPRLHGQVQVLRRRPPSRRQGVQAAFSNPLRGTGLPKGTRLVAIGHEGACGNAIPGAKPPAGPQSTLTLSEPREPPDADLYPGGERSPSREEHR